MMMPAIATMTLNEVLINPVRSPLSLKVAANMGRSMMAKRLEMLLPASKRR